MTAHHIKLTREEDGIAILTIDRPDKRGAMTYQMLHTFIDAVREAGCTLGQGYYFSRAVPDYLAAMLLTQESDDDKPVRAQA